MNIPKYLLEISFFPLKFKLYLNCLSLTSYLPVKRHWLYMFSIDNGQYGTQFWGGIANSKCSKMPTLGSDTIIRHGKFIYYVPGTCIMTFEKKIISSKPETLLTFWFQEIQEVNVRALDDVVQRFIHRFIGNTPQRQTFYNIRKRIHDLVKTFADNVQIFLYVDDVFDKPLIISAGKKENELDIIIKIDGSLEVRWKKETCSYKTVR